MRRVNRSGFSLLEVVIAIGVVASGVTVLLALLPGLLRSTAESVDLQVALRLADAIEVRLDEARAGAFPGGVQNGLTLVADKAGTAVWREAQTDTTSRAPYFHIAVRAFASGDLAHQAGRSVLPLQVRVAWPYEAVVAAGDGEAGNYQTVGFVVTLAP